MGIPALSQDELLIPRDVADYLGSTENSLAIDRHRGRGLPYVRIGGRIRYRASDIQAYLDANTVKPGA